MEYTRACRAANLWPTVIADLIGGYAEYSLEERLDLIIGSPSPNSIVMLDPELGHCIAWTTYTCWPGLLRNVLVMHTSRESPKVEKDELIRDMLARRWHSGMSGWERPMSSDELELTDALLTNIAAGGDGDLGGPFTPLLPLKTSKT